MSNKNISDTKISKDIIPSHWHHIIVAFLFVVSIFAVFHLSLDGYFVTENVWVASWSKWLVGSVAFASALLLFKKDSKTALHRFDYALLALIAYLIISSIWNPDIYNFYITISYGSVIIFVYFAFRHLPYYDLLRFIEFLSIFYEIY